MEILQLNSSRHHAYTAGLAKGQGPVVLFLHGLKLIPEEISGPWLALKDQYDYLAPSGPIPAMRAGKDALELCYSWYLFDRKNERYLYGVEDALTYLENFIAQLAPGRDIIIVGFSQGAYLAPYLLNTQLPIKAVALLAGLIRSDIIPCPDKTIPIWQFHDMKDPYVDGEKAKGHLKSFSPAGEFFEIEGMGHYPYSAQVEKILLQKISSL